LPESERREDKTSAFVKEWEARRERVCNARVKRERERRKKKGRERERG